MDNTGKWSSFSSESESNTNIFVKKCKGKQYRKLPPNFDLKVLECIEEQGKTIFSGKYYDLKIKIVINNKSQIIEKIHFE